jgi:hypothetical protein
MHSYVFFWWCVSKDLKIQEDGFVGPAPISTKRLNDPEWVNCFFFWKPVGTLISFYGRFVNLRANKLNTISSSLLFRSSSVPFPLR